MAAPRRAAASHAARPRAGSSIRKRSPRCRRCSATGSRRRDLLIEHLHLIQDKYGFISSAHMAALAAEMKLAQTEVYEVATFYAHFDVVKEGETPPPPVTVRVCDSLSCAMAGRRTAAEGFAEDARAERARGARALHGRLRPRAGLRRRPRPGDAGDRALGGQTGASLTAMRMRSSPAPTSSITWRPAAIGSWAKPSPASARATN